MDKYEKVSKYIKSTVKVNGFHSWPDAPKVVEFLRSTHRHVFHITLTWPITEDRQHEFFLAQSSMLGSLKNEYNYTSLGFEFKNRSCETLAEEILNEHPLAIMCNVSEDGENSSTVCREAI